MRLRLKKAVAYVGWPLLWFAVEAGYYASALRPALREYRFHTRGGWDSFKRGYAYIHGFGRDG